MTNIEAGYRIPEHPSAEEAAAVNAIIRDPDNPLFPCPIVVFCDRCGVQSRGDFMVTEGTPSAQRLSFARKDLVDRNGWQCAEEDLCLHCKEK